MNNRKLDPKEVITENLFRNFYGSLTFIEKNAIPKEYGFKSKNKTNEDGYPDFFLDLEEFTIVVEAKSVNQQKAISEVKYYISDNSIIKDIIGIAVSGQSKETIKFDVFLRIGGTNFITKISSNDTFLTLSSVNDIYRKNRFGETVTNELLNKTLTELNKNFHDSQKVKDTERSLFFSGIMIALKDTSFRATYQNLQPPETLKNKISNESSLLNQAIIDAISRQLNDKINNQSKEYNWKDRFSFIKNIDYSLIEYKAIIKKVEQNIYNPFSKSEKLDILGRAYKIFLKRAGKIENKNIILTPDHIKSLMVSLARLSPNDVVLDTCTGSGGFLIESMEILIGMANGENQKIENVKNHQLIGLENDPILFALACSNMFLHGDGKTNLVFRNSLLNNSAEDKTLKEYIKNLKPTKVIINPPYENNMPIQFTIQAIDFLELNGILVIIMPTPTLRLNIKSGYTDSLLQKARLVSIIKMPFNLFSEQERTVNSSIFIFSKTPHNPSDEVLFVDLEDDGLISVQHKGRIDKHNRWEGIKMQILDCVLNSKEVDGFSYKSKIYDGDGLHINGIRPNRRIGSKMKTEKFDEIFTCIKGKVSSEDSEEGEYPLITGAESWKSHNTYDFDGEYLIYVVSASGSLGRCHYINGKFAASNLCLVLSPKPNYKDKINLKFYHSYFNFLRKSIIKETSDGTSKLTILKELLFDYDIDMFDKTDQDEFVRKHYEPTLIVKNNFIDKIREKEIENTNAINNLLGASSI